MAEPIIEVRDLSKDFLLPHLRQTTIKSHALRLFRRARTIELQHALRDITFDVQPGEFLGVVGRNGSGKSTLLKIIAGIYAPTSGAVTVRGRLVPFIELGVGFNAELTGRENVYLNGALLGFSKSEVAAMYDDIVAFAELEDSMDQKLKNYSTGMQVRIAFSMATRAKGDIILIDEVLAVGDTAFQRKCYEHFRALKRRGTTIIFVSHAMAAIREFCDRALLIEDCRLVAEGSADDIAARYMELFNPSAAPAAPRTTEVPRPSLPTAAETQDGTASDVPVAAEGDARPDRPSEVPRGRRSGSGAARYLDVSTPDVLSEGADLTLGMKVRAEEDVGDVLYAFVIRNASGTPVMGTDSSLKTAPSGGLRRGQVIDVTWTVPNIFSDGVHHLEVTISDRQGVTIYDRWEDAASFTVLKEERTPYLVTPHTRLRVTPSPD